MAYSQTYDDSVPNPVNNLPAQLPRTVRLRVYNKISMEDISGWKPFKALYDVFNDLPPAPPKQAKSKYHDPYRTESFARAASIIFIALRMFSDAARPISHSQWDSQH